MVKEWMISILRHIHRCTQELVLTNGGEDVMKDNPEGP